MSASRIQGARELLARVHEKVAGSAWTPLAGRAGAYALGFALLVLVGSGRLSRWVSPPAPVIATAEAATARPAASASASATAPAPSASASANMTTDAGAPDADAGDGGASSGVASDGKVILNLATEEDLRRLPGVGPTRAKAILALRARMKRLGRVEDLLKVKGIGRRSLARLRPLVRVD